MSFFCAESLLRCKNRSATSCGSRDQEWYCATNEGYSSPSGTNHHRDHGYTLTGVPPRNPFDYEWVTVPIEASQTDPLSIVADISSLNGTSVVAVRYAWGVNCCANGDPMQGISYPCKAQSCPVVSSKSKLPANPFMARIDTGTGKCRCMAPQVCDA